MARSGLRIYAILLLGALSTASARTAYAGGRIQQDIQGYDAPTDVPLMQQVEDQQHLRIQQDVQGYNPPRYYPHYTMKQQVEDQYLDTVAPTVYAQQHQQVEDQKWYPTMQLYGPQRFPVSQQVEADQMYDMETGEEQALYAIEQQRRCLGTHIHIPVHVPFVKIDVCSVTARQCGWVEVNAGHGIVDVQICERSNGQLCYRQRNNDCSRVYLPVTLPISVPTPRGGTNVNVLVHPFPFRACVRVHLPTC